MLAKACGVDRSEVLTVAALLGLKEVKTEGEVDFVPSGAKSRLGENDIWLIDEASMISRTILGYIESDIDMFTKVIFIGDSSQLAPVGSSDISPALQIEPSFKLTKVLRHGGAILEAATAIRATSGEIWRPLFTESSISHGQEVNL